MTPEERRRLGKLKDGIAAKKARDAERRLDKRYVEMGGGKPSSGCGKAGGDVTVVLILAGMILHRALS